MVKQLEQKVAFTMEGLKVNLKIIHIIITIRNKEANIFLSSDYCWEGKDNVFLNTDALIIMI